MALPSSTPSSTPLQTGDPGLDVRQEGGALVGGHHPGGVTQGHRLSAGGHGGGQDLVEEVPLGPGGVQGGELHMLRVVPGLGHQGLHQLQHGGSLLVAQVLHLHRGDGDHHVEGGVPGGLHALPGGGHALLGEAHGSGEPGGGHHGGDGLVAEHVGLLIPDGGQLNGVHLEAVQGPGDLHPLLEAQGRGAGLADLPQGDVGKFHSLHGASPFILVWHKGGDNKKRPREQASLFPGRQITYRGTTRIHANARTRQGSNKPLPW